MDEDYSPDVRNSNSGEYDPREALVECLDLWASGAWDDSNAPWNLSEVMGHVEALLDSTTAAG